MSSSRGNWLSASKLTSPTPASVLVSSLERLGGDSPVTGGGTQKSQLSSGSPPHTPGRGIGPPQGCLLGVCAPEDTVIVWGLFQLSQLREGVLLTQWMETPHRHKMAPPREKSSPRHQRGPLPLSQLVSSVCVREACWSVCIGALLVGWRKSGFPQRPRFKPELPPLLAGSSWASVSPSGDQYDNPGLSELLGRLWVLVLLRLLKHPWGGESQHLGSRHAIPTTGRCQWEPPGGAPPTP